MYIHNIYIYIYCAYTYIYREREIDIDIDINIDIYIYILFFVHMAMAVMMVPRKIFQGNIENCASRAFLGLPPLDFLPARISCYDII